jgi:hypothetical protein
MTNSHKPKKSIPQPSTPAVILEFDYIEIKDGAVVIHTKTGEQLSIPRNIIAFALQRRKRKGSTCTGCKPTGWKPLKNNEPTINP